MGYRRKGGGLMSTMWTIALVVGAGYVVSLILHPYATCGACRKTPGRHHGAVFTYAHRKCTKCGGTGRKLRVGTRLLLGRTEKK